MRVRFCRFLNNIYNEPTFIHGKGRYDMVVVIYINPSPIWLLLSNNSLILLELEIFPRKRGSTYQKNFACRALLSLKNAQAINA